MLQVQSGFAELNGTRFAYDMAGTGHPLVLLHAGIADRRMWDAQFALFAEHYQVLRYDLRGFGQTSMVAGPFSHHEDLYALLQFLGIGQAHLLGCSMGGATIIDFALEHPSMVSALIPVASGLSGYRITVSTPEQRQEIETAYYAGNLERVAEFEIHTWVDGPYRTPDQVDPVIRAQVYEMNLLALATPDGLGEEQPLVPPAVDRLGELHVPTLVMLGELDVPAMSQIGDMLVSGISAAQKLVIPGTAHVPNMEQPAIFSQAVLDFLGKQR